MTEDELDPRARAGETKKRRTRSSLREAADTVMFEQGLEATVEAIAKQAGVSTATFYSFYSSRNLLCLDAVKEFVIGPLDEYRHANFKDTADRYRELAADRWELVHATLLALVAEAQEDDLIEQLAQCLADDEMREAGASGNYDSDENHPGTLALYMAAMHLLFTESDEPANDALETVVRRACGLPART